MYRIKRLDIELLHVVSVRDEYEVEHLLQTRYKIYLLHLRHVGGNVYLLIARRVGDFYNFPPSRLRANTAVTVYG